MRIPRVLASLSAPLVLAGGALVAAHSPALPQSAVASSGPGVGWTASQPTRRPVWRGRTIEAPAAVSAYYPVSYPGRRILPSARVDTKTSTVTLPLHRGRMRDHRLVWYVLTDTSDRRLAKRLGLNWSPKLRNAPKAAVRSARMSRDASLVFDAGAVDFTPQRSVVPGPAPRPFPPAHASPGSVADAEYSPLVRIEGGPGAPAGAVVNATVVAFDVSASSIEFPRGGIDYRLVLDRAVAISPAHGTVTFRASLGTAAGHPVLFVSLDSNSALVSALEATTYAPRLAALPVGTDARPGSAVTPNYVVTNGPTGAENPQRQGLDSALSDPGGQVLDVFSTVPGVVDAFAYSPMWDLYLSTWTKQAIDHGYRSALHGELEALGMAARGHLTAPDGGPVRASGLISNCPVLMSF